MSFALLENSAVAPGASTTSHLVLRQAGMRIVCIACAALALAPLGFGIATFLRPDLFLP